VKLHFLGANRQVTGSRYVLEAGGLRIMIDCGLFQERCCLDRNWAVCPIDPSKIDVLLLTHAHLDHCGLIPKLLKDGFRGSILATPPTIDLARLVMEDTADIQEEDAAYKKKRHERESRRGPHPEVPLYTKQDVANALPLFRIAEYGDERALNDRVRVTYRDAGHILGSAMLDITVQEGPNTRRIVFSGDIGPVDRALHHDPATFDRADYVIMESTYGDRDQVNGGTVRENLARVINDTVERGGNIVIPTFAIDRAQELMLHLGELVRDERIPRLTVFLDSPMAADATTIYKRFDHLFDDDARTMFEHGRHPFQFPGLHFVRSVSESQAINAIRGSCIILAGSGMCTGGRIKHHLRHNIDRPESTVLFVGYQSKDTLGRHILDGEKEVRIHGRPHAVRAKIERLYGLSAHADRAGLLNWAQALKSPPDHVFLTHGEEGPANALKQAIEAKPGYRAAVPDYLDVVELT
jgi:metallo-beta-lactamase family protein